MPFFKASPGVLRALQRMDEKFVKQCHPLNSISKIHDLYRRSEKPEWASLKRDGLDRPNRMLWAIEHMEHIVERLNVAPGSLLASNQSLAWHAGACMVQAGSARTPASDSDSDPNSNSSF